MKQFPSLEYTPVIYFLKILLLNYFVIFLMLHHIFWYILVLWLLILSCGLLSRDYSRSIIWWFKYLLHCSLQTTFQIKNSHCKIQEQNIKGSEGIPFRLFLSSSTQKYTKWVELRQCNSINYIRTQKTI